MSKMIATRRTTMPVGRPGPSRRAGWVRKNMAMDQRKLDAARRVLGVETETEAIDQALDLVTFGKELAKGFATVRRIGGIEDVGEGRRRA